MSSRCFNIVIIVLLCIFSFVENNDAREIKEDRHIHVAMRMIGHEMLLHSGDSSSLVLPVEKEGERYYIQFESDIQFFPTKLLATTNKAIRESGIASSYRVEIEKEGTDEIVYSYQIGNSTADDMIPCAGRDYPRGRYNIFITILDTGAILDAANAAALARLYATDDKENNYFKIGMLNISLLIVIGSFIFFWRKKRNIKPLANPNMIYLGAYQFDKKKMELLLDDKKTELTAKEADLLLLLHSSANETLEREQLLKKVWGDEGDYVGRTLDVFISKLRKKLEADSTVKIVNIRGVGYKLVMDS